MRLFGFNVHNLRAPLVRRRRMALDLPSSRGPLAESLRPRGLPRPIPPPYICAFPWEVVTAAGDGHTPRADEQPTINRRPRGPAKLLSEECRRQVASY